MNTNATHGTHGVGTPRPSGGGAPRIVGIYERPEHVPRRVWALWIASMSFALLMTLIILARA